MIPVPISSSLADYLAADDVIACQSTPIRDLATELGSAEAAFTFVRDEIAHSRDAGTWSAAYRSTDVLAARNAICHGKAHLLAALLRAQGVPAGLCYQKLRDDVPGGFVLHGLVGVYVDGKWSRIDARGNKPGVDAQFDLARERIAFRADPDLGEVDYESVYATTPRSLLDALGHARPGATNYEYLPASL